MTLLEWFHCSIYWLAELRVQRCRGTIVKLLITVFCSKAADAKSISPAVPLYIANSLHCGLPLDCKMLIHISELPVQALDGSADKCHVFLWGNSPQAWAGPWWGRRNDNDHHLCCEFSLVRVFTVSLGETSAYTHLQDEAQEQTPQQLLHLKGISSPQTANKEFQISSCRPDSVF